MEQLKCFSCGESNLKAVGINQDNMVNCLTCGLEMSAKDYIELNGLKMTESELIGHYRRLIEEDTTMSDVLEIVNSNIEFTKKHSKVLDKKYDASDLPF